MNYKVYLRVRPIDYDQSMIKIVQNAIQIKDPTNKQAEWQSFQYDKLFPSKTTQMQLFEDIFTYDYTQNNVCIISYGQSGSGKSYSLFGVQDNPGLIPLIVTKLLAANKQISVSFQEIYIDQVKDLNTGLITEEFTKRIIDSQESIWQIIQILRSTDIKKQVRTHVILSIEIDSQYKIQFIDLAGSERVAKNIQEGNKYQEAIMISSSLQVLGKCLNLFNQNPNKILPVKDSKLTQAIEFNPNAKIALIGNINPSESNYEECLLTLQYLDRTKNIQVQLRKQISNLGDSTPLNAQQDKTIKKQQEEIELLKQKVDAITADRKKRFLDLQKILCLDIDLEKLSAKNAKDLQQFKSQQEALIKVQSQQEIIEEYEQTINQLKYEITQLKTDTHQKIEKYSQQLIEQKEINKKLKDAISISKMSGDDAVRQLISERDKQVKRLFDDSNMLLEDKVNAILNLPQTAQTKNIDNQKMQEIKKQIKSEAEKENQKLLEGIKGEYAKWLQTCKSQYEYYLNQKNEEIESFILQLKKYREKKKLQINEIAGEIVDLYDIISKQAKIIEKIELGQYSGGLKSFNIPKQDKPLLPNKIKHKNLFKFLDNRSQNTTLTKKGTFNEKTIKNAQSLPKQMRQSLSRDVYVEIDTLDALNLNQMDFTTLRAYAHKLKDMVKEHQDQILVVQDKYKQQIVAITRERDDAVQRYNVESRRYNQTRVVIESQNRIISKVRPISSVHRK